MNAQENNIREYRLAAGLSMQALADKIGTSKSQIDKLEKGHRRLTVDWMQRLAPVLDCAMADLLPEEQSAKAQDNAPRRRASDPGFNQPPRVPTFQTPDLPLYSRQFSGETHEMVVRPINLIGVKNAFAAYVSDDTMSPRYFPGEIVYANPNRPLTEDCFVAVELNNGKSIIKQMVKKDSESVTLKQISPSATAKIPLNTIKTIARIVGTGEI